MTTSYQSGLPIYGEPPSDVVVVSGGDSYDGLTAAEITALAAKADLTYVDAGLAGKVDASALSAELSSKADVSALSAKADSSTLAGKVSIGADGIGKVLAVVTASAFAALTPPDANTVYMVVG